MMEEQLILPIDNTIRRRRRRRRRRCYFFLLEYNGTI